MMEPYRLFLGKLFGQKCGNLGIPPFVAAGAITALETPKVGRLSWMKDTLLT